MTQFKKCKVVRLPTENNKADLYRTFATKNFHPNLTKLDKEAVYVDVEYLHLYILSDEEIREGDWYFRLDLNEVRQCRNFFTKEDTPPYCKKIIATTDPSINTYESSTPYYEGKQLMPRPSDAFIKKYCELCGIDEVLVEYENIQLTKKEDYQYSNGISNLKYEDRLKVAPDNTITIKKVKDSWKREELPVLKNISERMKRCRKILQERNNGNWGILDTSELDKWIEENL